MAVQQRDHVESETAGLRDLLQTNTDLTERIVALTTELHAATFGGGGEAGPGAVNPGT